MRYFVHFILLLSLLSTQALANDSQLVELVVFRQSNETLPASRIAPDDWARNATLITPDMQRTTQLDHLVRKLTPDHGYQVLLHQAWLQNSQEGIAHVAISAGDTYFEHHPIEGHLHFTLDRTNTVQLELWINQFTAEQTLLSSERFKQKAMVANDQVTFIDHSNLGALIRIQPLKNNQPIKTAPATPDAVEFE